MALTGGKQNHGLQQRHLRIVQVEGGQRDTQIKDGVRDHTQTPVLELAPRDSHLPVQRQSLALGIVSHCRSQRHDLHAAALQQNDLVLTRQLNKYTN